MNDNEIKLVSAVTAFSVVVSKAFRLSLDVNSDLPIDLKRVQLQKTKSCLQSAIDGITAAEAGLDRVDSGITDIEEELASADRDRAQLLAAMEPEEREFSEFVDSLRE